MRAQFRRLLSLALAIATPACHAGEPTGERSPQPPSPRTQAPSVADPSSARDSSEAAVATPKSLSDFGPFFEADVREGQLHLIVPSSSNEEWDHWSEEMPDRVPASHPAVPLDVKALGRIFVVSTRGVDSFNSYDGVALHEGGWLVDYPAPELAGPVLGMTSRPAQGARLRAPEPMKRIEKGHPRARLLSEHVAREHSDDGGPPVDLMDFEFQELEGGFGAADRVVAIRAYSALDDADMPFVGHGLIATLKVDGDVIHEVYSGGDCALDGVFDLDGDGVDEVLYFEYGYEYLARRLVKLSPSPTEQVELFEHAE